MLVASGHEKGPVLRGLSHAPNWTRTSTDVAVHQALNLAGPAVGGAYTVL